MIQKKNISVFPATVTRPQKAKEMEILQIFYTLYCNLVFYCFTTFSQNFSFDHTGYKRWT